MEMLVLIDVLQQIRNNHTHKTFVEQLRPALDDMTEAVRHLLREIRVHFCAFAACPESLRGCVALVRRLSSSLQGANANDANAKHHHHHHRHHHRRHSHHRHSHRPPSRYDPISPMTVMRLSNADLDVEMMAMINNNDDDDSASESDGEEEDSDGDGEDDSDSDANGDDSEVSGEDGDRSTNSIVVTLDGGGDSSTDASKAIKGGGNEDGEIDVEKAVVVVAANATTTSATAVATNNTTIDGRDNASAATIAAANNDNDNHSVDGVSGADDTPLHRLREARAGLLEGYRRTRELFVFPKAFPPPSPVPQDDNIINDSNNIINNNIINNKTSTKSSARTSTRLGDYREGGVGSLRHETTQAAVQEETSHLRWRNLLPRSVYLHRVSLLIDGFIAMGAVRQARVLVPFSVAACVWRAVSTLVTYFSGALMDLVHGLGAGLALALSLCQRTPHPPVNPAAVDSPTSTSPSPAPPAASSPSSSSPSMMLMKTWLLAYAQPMKIALAITTTALFIVVPQLQYAQMQNGLWATVCIAFIRQVDTSPTSIP